MATRCYRCTFDGCVARKSDLPYTHQKLYNVKRHIWNTHLRHKRDAPDNEKYEVLNKLGRLNSAMNQAIESHIGKVEPKPEKVTKLKLELKRSSSGVTHHPTKSPRNPLVSSPRSSPRSPPPGPSHASESFAPSAPSSSPAHTSPRGPYPPPGSRSRRSRRGIISGSSSPRISPRASAATVYTPPLSPHEPHPSETSPPHSSFVSYGAHHSPRMHSPHSSPRYAPYPSYVPHHVSGPVGPHGSPYPTSPPTARRGSIPGLDLRMGMMRLSDGPGYSPHSPHSPHGEYSSSLSSEEFYSPRSSLDQFSSHSPYDSPYVTPSGSPRVMEASHANMAYADPQHQRMPMPAVPPDTHLYELGFGDAALLNMQQIVAEEMLKHAPDRECSHHEYYASMDSKEFLAATAVVENPYDTGFLAPRSETPPY
eukprot:TRINITY_DN355_c0_g1_i5.p1 TRINITY_DN355_c0_g1~~TRINITY_DN355_c0_g1_i5.p1  ORF type:complete len:442 (-),score=-51.66 TRINITY_DN355_c0_g1_i5:174-1442(-)